MPDLDLPLPDDESRPSDKTFSRIIALTVSTIAVALAVTSLGGNNNARDIMLAQQQATDKWAYYQAKTLRETAYKIQARHLEFEIAERGPTMTPELRAQAETMLSDFRAEQERYYAEKKEIETGARALEASRDVNLLREPYFDYAEVLLQIAIVLASVAMLSESVAIYSASIVAALLGGGLACNGFLLIFGGPAAGGG